MDETPVSEICQDRDIQPSVLYTWQRELCLRGANLFETKLSPCKVDLSDKKVAALEAKLAEKDGVIAALPQEHVELEKLLD